MKISPKPMGELGLIEQIRRDFRRTSRNITLGIGDDCAVLRPPAGVEIVVTTDLTLEDRHFLRRTHPAESVGHRCLARGLSDLAAMGATPLAAFLSLAMPGSFLASRAGRRWTAGFFSGLRGLADSYGVPLAGGDTSESPRGARDSEGLILADIVLVGATPKGKALRRSGATPGDALYVTGCLGGAAAELKKILHHKRPGRTTATRDHPHLYPEPRIAVGRALLQRGLATACIDISDGLSTDLAHLCRASGVHAEVIEEQLPLHPLARKLNPQGALHAALHGGEDYELLFSASMQTRIPASMAGVPISRIGRLTRRSSGTPLLTLLAPNGERASLEPSGWEHFSPKLPNRQSR